jgi:hypothetical protein
MIVTDLATAPDGFLTWIMCGMKWPLRAKDTEGNTVGMCYQLRGQLAEFEIDRDCHVVRITGYDGRTHYCQREGCDHHVKKGQVVNFVLGFS